MNAKEMALFKPVHARAIMVSDTEGNLRSAKPLSAGECSPLLGLIAVMAVLSLLAVKETV